MPRLAAMHGTTIRAVSLATLCLGLTGLGCKRDQPKPLPLVPTSEDRQQMLNPELPPGHPPIHAQGEAMPGMPPSSAGEQAALAWDLPSGWTEARSGGMRFATLKPPVAGKVDVSVISLGGTAGGELANVNRWRGQLGLPPVDEEGRLQMRKEIKSKAGTISLYDFTGAGADKQRMVAGLLFVDDRSWFLKMTGDVDAVQAARAGFVKVLESLRVPADK